MQPGNQDPQHTQQAKDQERVVEPQPAARINNHQNACSAERAFACKNARRHKLVTRLLVAVVCLTACVSDPARVQSVSLLDQLVLARAMFGEQPPQVDEACNVVGSVQNRLYGEPGLSGVRPAWPALLTGARALQSVCGQSTLLAQPSNDSVVLVQARQRWQMGIQREMAVACDHLRVAAEALSRPAPC
ncbi:MAG: hypothetical protein M3069_06750 [Chloroflexota bacterium]|nr:hypothetical protein [Chloroflexota bacterium]